MRPLLVILVLDVQEERLDVVRLRVASMLVQGQVVIGEITFKLAHILDEGLVFALKGQISGVVFVDILHLLFHLVDFSGYLIVLVSHQVVVVVAIVDLPTWPGSTGVHSRETSVCNGSLN